MRSVVEMDTGLRGYYLTGDQTFLDSYNDLKAKLPEQLDTTMDLTADNPEQQARLRQLQDLYARWMQWAGRQIERGHQNPPTPEELLAGQRLMTEIRNQQRDFINAEDGLRRLRSHRANVLNGSVIGFRGGSFAVGRGAAVYAYAAGIAGAVKHVRTITCEPKPRNNSN